MGNALKNVVVLGIGAVAVLYLIYPSAGIFELIPDVIPFVGSLDEATATLLLTNVLAYYGLDVTRIFGRTPRKNEDVIIEGKRKP
jgi:uncharacterized membrane protein YkvA (DUF1232 family)